jgi:hypothetical protein
VGGRVEQAEDREQRGFATPRRPGNRHVLAFPNVHVDAREGVRLHFVGEKHLGDAVELEERLRARVVHSASPFVFGQSRAGSASVQPMFIRRAGR